MKWLALMLFAINALLWMAADFWTPDRVAEVVAAETLPRVSTLKVDASPAESDAISADRRAEPETYAETVPPEQPVDPEIVPVVQRCIRLGWFQEMDKALEAYRSIGSPGISYEIIEQERSLEPLHWVIIPPQPGDRALRQFNDLRNRGIDSYLVTRGENTNAISLGLFQSRKAAERVLKEKKRQNLNAILANFPRNQLSYALVFEVSPESITSAGDGRLRDYGENFDMVEISRCEGIATTPENP
jgi:hypothetical protein